MTLSEWIDSHPFQYNKVNVRPWGSFELQVSIDGRLAHLREIRGWGWTEKDAFQDILTGMLRDVRFHNTLSSWLGHERFDAAIIVMNANPAEEPDGIGDRKKILSQIECVEERRESEISVNEDQTGISEQRSSGEGNATSSVVDGQGENQESSNTS